MSIPTRNPHLMRAGYGKVFFNNRPFAKFYCGHVGHGTRKFFRTATGALRYSERVLIRYRRLYDAAIVAAVAE